MRQGDILKNLTTKQSNILLFVLTILFFGFGFIAMQNAKPFPKEERIYSLIQKEMPYTLEKRVGGFTIVFKDSADKVKPSNEELFRKLESIDKFWAKTHLKVLSDKALILDTNQTVAKEIKFENDKEKEFVITYFGIKETK